MRKKFKPGDVIKLSVKDREEAEGLALKETALRRAIIHLSESAAEANDELWNFISQVHPETDDYMCRFDPRTGKVTLRYDKTPEQKEGRVE